MKIKPAKEKTITLLFFIVIALEIVCFILDMQIPRGYSKWVLYFFPLLLIWNTNPFQIYLTVSIVTFLEILGFIYSPQGGIPLITTILNRLSGIIIFWTVSIIFISRLKALRENKAQREFLDSILTSATVGIAVYTGRDLRIIYVNDAYQSIRPDKPMRGKLYKEIFPEAAEAGAEQMIQTVINTGEPWILRRYSAPVPGRPDAAWEGTVVYLKPTDSKPEPSALSITWEVTEWNRIEKQLKKREKELKDSENKFRTLAENAPEVIARFDRHLRHIYINTYGAKVYGISPEEVLGKTNAALGMPADKVAFWKEHFDNILATGQMQKVEFDFESPNYGHQYFSSIFVPEFDENRNVVTILAITRDITDLKISENNLRQSVSINQKILDSSLNGIYIFDVDENGVVFVNKQYSRITGYTLDDLKSLDDFFSLFHPDEHEKMRNYVEQIQSLKPGDVREIEYRLCHRDGTWIWCLSRESEFLRTREGRIKQYIGTFVNITERKNAEDALRASEQKFRELADSMPQLVWTARPDGIVDYYNEHYHDFGGITLDSDGTWKWCVLIHEDDLQATMDDWNTAVKTGESYQHEHRIMHADGSFHWYLSRATPVKNERNEIIKWYGTATNIDISKKAQFELEASENRLRLLNENLENIVIQRTQQVRSLATALTLAEQRERKRVSYTLHDNLQQKLFGVRLLLGQHLREHKTAVPEGEYDDVEDSVTILDNAIQTTKALSVELNPPILNSQGLDAALQWLAQHMKKNYNLDVDLMIKGAINSIRNETQLMLTQMVRELLSNVLRHSGVKACRISARCRDGRVTIEVSDKGNGFNPEEEIRKSNDETRLSLFSIRERLKLFNGDLSINSRFRRGTTCVISLPVLECQE